VLEARAWKTSACRKAQCQGCHRLALSSFKPWEQVILSEVREGLSVVDVALLDGNDRELEHIASSSFIVQSGSSQQGVSSENLLWQQRIQRQAERWQAQSNLGQTSSAGLFSIPSEPYKLLISFATDAMRHAGGIRRLAVSAIQTGGLDGIKMFGPEHLDKQFVASTTNVIGRRRGAGYWLWKPYLINRTLHEMSEGDLLFYVDAQLYFVSTSDPLFEMVLVEPSGIVLFGMAMHAEKKFTKRQVFTKMKVDRPEVTDTPQRAATFILFRNCENARDFVQQWLELCKDSELISDEETCGDEEDYEDYMAHRHDQSIFSVLSKIRGIPAYRLPTQYGLEPPETDMPGLYPQILVAK